MGRAGGVCWTGACSMWQAAGSLCKYTAKAPTSHHEQSVHASVHCRCQRQAETVLVGKASRRSVHTASYGCLWDCYAECRKWCKTAYQNTCVLDHSLSAQY
jgi:hypothetical protein